MSYPENYFVNTFRLFVNVYLEMRVPNASKFKILRHACTLTFGVQIVD